MPRVGRYAGIQQFRRLPVYQLGILEQLVDDKTRARRAFVHDVYIAELRIERVMIYIDRMLRRFERRGVCAEPFLIGAIDRYKHVVRLFPRLAKPVDIGQERERNRLVRIAHRVRRFAEVFADPAHGERRADAIAVGAHMSAHEDIFSALDKIDELTCRFRHFYAVLLSARRYVRSTTATCLSRTSTAV